MEDILKPAVTDLPLSTVKRALSKETKDAQWTPDAVSLAGAYAEDYLTAVGKRAEVLANREGRKRVTKEHMVMALLDMRNGVV